MDKFVLDHLLSSAVARRDVPMAVLAVADRERVIYRGAVGAPVDAIFRIASMTKAITSTAVMLLHERGLLRLDDRLDHYLPEFAQRQVITSFDPVTHVLGTRQASGPITIRHLLTHTSGFGYEFTNPILSALGRDGHSPRNLPLLHDPGARWTYGMSTALLGDVIERITGDKFHVFLKTQILDPLEMRDTDYFLHSKEEARLVPVYYRTMDGGMRQAAASPFRPSLEADGGLLATAGDYIVFLQMLLNGGVHRRSRLLSPDSVHALTRNQIGDLTVQTQLAARPETAGTFPIGGGVDNFSFAFQVKVALEPGARAPGSFSWGGIYNTQYWADPVNDIAIVLMTQLLPFADLKCNELLAQVEHAIYS